MKRLFLMAIMFTACATEAEQSELASSASDEGGLESEPAMPNPTCAAGACDAELEFELVSGRRPHIGFCGFEDRCGPDATCFKGECIAIECNSDKDCGENEACHKQHCVQPDRLTRPGLPR